MIRLPQVPNLQPSNPQPTAPSAAAMAAPARALEDVSRGLATVGTALTSEALRIQQIENSRRESEIRQSWQQSLAQLNTRLATETDPTRIPQLTEDLLAELSGTVEDESLPPALQRRLSEQYNEFSTNTTIRAGEQASRLAITRAQKAFQNEAEFARHTGDRALMEHSIETATEAFGLLPEDAERALRQFDTEQDRDILNVHIEADPDYLLEFDQQQFKKAYPNLDGNDYRRAQSAAKRQIQQYRAEEIEAYAERLAQGNLTAEEIDNADRLTTSDRQRLKKTLEAANPLDFSKHPEAWDVLFNLRKDYTDPTVTDEDYAAKWNDARVQTMTMVPDGHTGDLRQELSYRSPANRRGGAGDPTANLHTAKEYNSIARERLRHAQREELIDFVQYQDINASLTRWIKQNPTASWEQMKHYVDSQVGTSLDDGPNPIIPAMPPASAGIDTARILRAIGTGAYPQIPTEQVVTPDLPDQPPGTNTVLLPPIDK